MACSRKRVGPHPPPGCKVSSTELQAAPRLIQYEQQIQFPTPAGRHLAACVNHGLRALVSTPAGNHEQISSVIAARLFHHGEQAVHSADAAAFWRIPVKASATRDRNAPGCAHA